MNTLQIDIITPNGADLIPEATFLDAPAEEGRLTVLPRHEPLICYLTGGDVTIRESGETETQWIIGEGTLSVTQKTATVLVQHASRRTSP